MRTLRELAENARGGRPLEIELGDFLDTFYLAPDPARVQERPALLASTPPQGAMIDAFLASRSRTPLPAVRDPDPGLGVCTWPLP